MYYNRTLTSNTQINQNILNASNFTQNYIIYCKNYGIFPNQQLLKFSINTFNNVALL